MLGFNYNNFKEAVKKNENEKHEELTKDVNEVRSFVEKMLSLSLDSSANRARTNYPGVEL